MAAMIDHPTHAPRRRTVVRGTVATNVRLCDEHFLLRLDVGADYPPTRPGQFVQLQCNTPDPEAAPVVHDWSADRPPRFVRPDVVADEALLRRPFSLAGREAEGGRTILSILYRVLGRGSTWLSGLGAGDAVSVLGPLGNAFTWTDEMTTGLLVGGGVGLPPMFYLADALHRAGKHAQAFVGATTQRLLPLNIDPTVTPSKAGWPTPCAAEFARYGVETAVTTDDGSLGMEGLVTEALFTWIDQGRVDPAATLVYTCGPEPMMKAVAEGCFARDIACQVAMERKMACGMGTCQSCVCKTRAPTAPGWQYKLVCTDGTIFDARELVWE
ncbi:MAG: dihydroorotate dehydrogenase electron transfer subunit [Planctomycetota bacterium]